MIVEDEPDIFKLMKFLLEQEGYSVQGKTSGKEAVEYISHEQPRLVLLDLGLPDMSGFDVLKSIKNMKPDLPVVIVTGNHRETEARMAMELGAADYVTKPFDFNYLKNLLLFFRE